MNSGGEIILGEHFSETAPSPPRNRRPACWAIFRISPIARGVMSKPPVPPTPAAPMPPTGNTSPPGAGARASPPHILRPSAYTFTACASGTAERGAKASSVSTIERRLSSLSWNYSQRGLMLNRKDRHIATVMAGIRNSHARPPLQKEAVLAEDIVVMLETLDRGPCAVCGIRPCC